MKNVADIYPLTPTQTGILYHVLRSPQDDVYIQQISCTLQGPLDVEQFKRAWHKVVDHHPALRSIFLWEGVDEPLQVVRQAVTIPWDILDLRDCPREEQQGRLASLTKDYRSRGFDLSKAPILRMVLVRLAEDRFHFLWNFHHLLTDGWSTHLVFHEAFATYESMMRGEEPAQSPVRPFRDYIDWLRRQDMDTAENFWREYLAGFTAANPFQVDQPAQGLSIQHGEAILVLPADVTSTLKEIARQNRLTLNTVVQGAWSILLSRYSGEEDILFGTTLSGRPAELRGVEHMVGMFINTLPLRVKVAEQASLLPWLQELQTQQMQIRAYEYSSLARIQRFSDIEPGQPLFESIVVFENYPMDTGQEHSLEITDVKYREQSNYPLALLVLPGEEMRLLAIYDQSRFSADTIDRMLNHLGTILASMAADPKRSVGELPLMEMAESRQILVEWNDTDLPAISTSWVHDQIAALAKDNPERTAVIASNGALTYAQLDRLSNQLAHHLIQRGVQSGTPVGLYVERSTMMVVGILGILKAGGAYVPLDPSYPAQRIAFILNEIQSPVVVAQSQLAAQLDLPQESYLLLDDGWSQLNGMLDDKPNIVIDPSSLAFIIYTSGSTGMPKGVMVTHSNLFHSTAARPHYYQQKVDGYLLLSSFAFDSSVAGIFWTLTDGGTLVLPAPGDERDIEQLARLIMRHRVTHTLALPSLYRLLLDYAPSGSLDSLQTVIVAGEACPPDLWDAHVSRLPRAALYNEYGPTEASVWSSVYRLTGRGHQKSVPIGRPIPNYRLYVLDRQNRPVPVGVPGELVVGGPGIVPGYWKRPDLTQERFLPNPFGEGRVYRTGDRVRWLPDGNLEFLGRVDHQVKIRGYRIELGEIETILRQNPAVRDALITFKNGRLVAYLIAEPDQLSTTERTNRLRSDIARRLPEYMLPSAWCWLAEFPRTPNGKLNRKSLPEPEGEAGGSSDLPLAPSTETEKQVRAIWSDLLGIQGIGMEDDFFSLGGHSLLMIQLVSRLRQSFKLPIPLSAVIDVRTIAGQAARIDILQWNASGAVPGTRADGAENTREEFEI